MRKNILLVNTGTPTAPTPSAVRTYLRQFLSDPRILTIPAPLRTLLLELIILPRRSAASARKYAAIWTERGSPLAWHTEDLALALAERLEHENPGAYKVHTAMRYGLPPLLATLKALPPSDSLLVVPLFLQSAAATSGSILATVHEQLRGRWHLPALSVPAPLGTYSAVQACLAETIVPLLSRQTGEHLLFSFHGLPEQHLRRSSTETEDSLCGHPPDCCAREEGLRSPCYRFQCLALARELASRLELAPDRWSAAFQSRFGRGRWIGPSTEERVKELATGGLRRLVVACPSFVTDCLETEHELGLELRAAFLGAGGREFVLAPCLNSQPSWVQALGEIVMRCSGVPRP